MHRMIKLVEASVIALILVACSQPTPTVPVTIMPPGPSPTPIVCTENPVGLAVSVQPLGNHEVRVTGQGFEPGEQLLLVFTTEKATATGHRRARMVETRPAQGVSANGTFSIEDTLQPLDDSITTWHLAVVHRRGVTCLDFTVP